MKELPAGWTRERGEQVAKINPGPSVKVEGDIDVSFLAIVDVSESVAVVGYQRWKFSEVCNRFS